MKTTQHYGVTEEELDYIINYGIKYRMGKGWRRGIVEMTTEIQKAVTLANNGNWDEAHQIVHKSPESLQI